MEIKHHLFSVVILGLILAFAFIHLGVSIGIIVPYRQYGDVFQPQVGLSAFNLVIFIFALVTGILGLVSIFMDNRLLCKMAAGISGVLGVFALASLIAALIMNSKSPSYVGTHFAKNMNKYMTDQNARNIINRLQMKRQCCGENMWFDWARIGLNATSPITEGNTTLTSTSALTTSTIITTSTSTTSRISSTTSVTDSSTSTSIVTTSVSSTATAAISDTSAVTATVSVGSTVTQTNPDSTASMVTTRDNVASTTMAPRIIRIRKESNLSPGISRRKRQANSTYGGISGLPLTFGVTLPASCCAKGAITTGNTSDSYCISNAGGIPNNFYIIGCSRSLDTTAGNQAMGIAVINCFMIVLAFVAVPKLLKISFQ